MANRQQFKVVLLGEGCVGKTSIILRYLEDKFNDKHYQTLQASFVTKKLNISGRPVNMAIWDTAGQERYHALGPIYYRDSNGAIVVYDITDEDSFTKARNWVKELRKIVGDITVCIVGNKTDLEKNRNVPKEEAEQYAASVKAKHYQTSAKLNKGIQELFLDLAKRMLEAQSSSSGSGSSNPMGAARQPQSQGGGRRQVILADDASNQPSSGGGGCCG